MIKWKLRVFTDNGWLMEWKDAWDDGCDVRGWCCMLADDEYLHRNYNIYTCLKTPIKYLVK